MSNETAGALEISAAFSTVKLGFTAKWFEFAHRVDVAIARHGNAVLGAFELCREIAKVRV